MEDYVGIKVRDLKEGQRFWYNAGDIGKAIIERMVRNGEKVWANGPSQQFKPCGTFSPKETVYAKSIINTGDIMSLQDELEQLETEIAGHRNAQGTLDGCITAKRKQVEGIKKQIADAEVTYSIGDRFENCVDKQEYILAQISSTEATMINLSCGNRSSSSREVSDTRCITPDEMLLLCTFHHYTRIWDNRKQQKVSE